MIKDQKDLPLYLMNNRQILVDLGCEDAVVFDNPSFDTAIIGTTSDGRAVYSFEKMIEELMETEEMEYDEATEFIECNTIRSLPYIQNAPVIVYNTSEF